MTRKLSDADVDALMPPAPVVRPIDVTPAPASMPQATVKVDACVGCGHLPHGSVNERISCLEREISRLRNKLGSERMK